MKKFISMLLAVTMLISCLSLGVFAASESDEYAFGEYAITADKTEVAVGETVTVTVSLKANAVYNVEGILTPSENLEYASHEILAGAEFAELDLNPDKGKFAALGNFTGYTGDIDLLTVTYKANKAGSASVALSNTIWTNEAGKAIAGNDDSVSVTVVEAPVVDVLWGDVSGDGWTDSYDAALILKYDAEFDVELDLESADVSGDGWVDSFDAALILKFDAELIDKFPVEE